MGPAWALDFRSVAEPAILYDAPATKANRLYVIARHTPVEVVVSLDAWCKVRDIKGDLAWIESRLLSSRRTVQVKTDRAQVRAQPEEKSSLVFEADRDVALEVVEPSPAPGWAKVQHRDGATGFVRLSQVWGL